MSLQPPLQIKKFLEVGFINLTHIATFLAI